MASRLVLCIGDLHIPDRAPVFPPDPSSWNGSHPSNPVLRTSQPRSYPPAPARSPQLPELPSPKPPLTPTQFRKLLSPGKIGQILCLGNLTDKETYDFLRSTAPDLQIVKGDFDVEATNLPLSKVVTHGNLRIGFTHGHTIIPQGDSDSLLIEARRLDCDVLVWGGTHRFEAYELEGRFFINPGESMEGGRSSEECNGLTTWA